MHKHLLVFILLCLSFSVFAQEDDKDDGKGIGGGSFRGISIPYRLPSSVGEVIKVGNKAQASKYCSQKKGKLFSKAKIGYKNETCFEQYCSKNVIDDSNKHFMSAYSYCHQKLQLIHVSDSSEARKECSAKSGHIFSMHSSYKPETKATCYKHHCAKDQPSNEDENFISIYQHCSSKPDTYVKASNECQKFSTKIVCGDQVYLLDSVFNTKVKNIRETASKKNDIGESINVNEQ
jgi:hypothetical protein